MTDDVATTGPVLGTLRTDDGVGVVRVEDRFATDADDLWSAITDPVRLDRWIGAVSGDLHLGGDFEARFHGSGWEGTGRVEVCEPPRRLLVTTRDADGPGGSTIEVLLSAEGAQTVLVVEERGMPIEHLADYGAGMQAQVEDLAAHVTGGERGDLSQRWAELVPAYRALAAEVD